MSCDSIMPLPYITPVTFMSMEKSQEVVKELLEKVTQIDWNSIEQKNSEGPLQKRLRVDLPAAHHLGDHEQLLKNLLDVVGVTREQTMARGDTAIDFLLLRVTKAKAALDSYTGQLKDELFEQLDLLIQSSLCNIKSYPVLKQFLENLLSKNNEVKCEPNGAHTLLTALCKIAESSPLGEINYAFTQFYKGFIEQCDEEETCLDMLTALLHLIDIKLPGEEIDEENLTIQSIQTGKISTVSKEMVVHALVKVLFGSSKSSIKGKLVEKFFESYLIHLSNHLPATEHGFNAINLIIDSAPLQYTKTLPSVFGHLLFLEKSSQTVYAAYERLLVEIMERFAGLQQLPEFVSALFQGAVLAKDNSPTTTDVLLPSLLPSSDQSSNEISRPLFSVKFVVKLEKFVNCLEPTQLCILLEKLLKLWKTDALPLLKGLERDSDSVWRVLCACGWLTGSVLRGVANHRASRVEGFTLKLANFMARCMKKILQPCLDTIATTSHVGLGLIGVLMMCRSWSSLFDLLYRSNTPFRSDWTLAARVGDEGGLLCHASGKIWQRIIAAVTDTGDFYAKHFLVTLFMEQVLRRLRTDRGIQGNAVAVNGKLQSSQQTKINKENQSVVNGETSNNKPEEMDFSESKQKYPTVEEHLVQMIKLWSDDRNDLIPSNIMKFHHVFQKKSDSKMFKRIVLDSLKSSVLTVNVADMTVMKPIFIDVVQQLRDIDCLLVNNDTPITYSMTVATTNGKRKITKVTEDETAASKVNEVTEEKRCKLKEFWSRLLLQLSSSMGVEIIDEKKTIKKKQREKFANSSEYCYVFKRFLDSANDESSKCVVKFSKNTQKNTQIMKMVLKMPISAMSYDQYEIMLVFLLSVFTHMDLNDLIQYGSKNETEKSNVGEDSMPLADEDKLQQHEDKTTPMWLLLVLINKLLDSPHKLQPLGSSVLTSLVCRLLAMLSHCTARVGGASKVHQQLCLLITRLLQRLSSQGVAPEHLTQLTTFVASIVGSKPDATSGMEADAAERCVLAPAVVLAGFLSKLASTSSSTPTALQSEALRCLRSLSSLCLRSLPSISSDDDTMTDVASTLHLITIFTTLVKMETRTAANRKEPTCDEVPVSDETKDDDKVETSVTVHVQKKPKFQSTSYGWQETDSSDPSELKSAIKTFHKGLNSVKGNSTANKKSESGLKHLYKGVQLARKCLLSEISDLQTAGLSFIIALKQLPEMILEKLPSDINRFTLNHLVKTTRFLSQLLITNGSNTKPHLKKYINNNLTNNATVTEHGIENNSTSTLLNCSKLGSSYTNLSSLIKTDLPSIETLFADCPREIYCNILKELLKQIAYMDINSIVNTEEKATLFQHNIALWHLIVSAKVTSSRAKENAVSAVSRTFLRLLRQTSLSVNSSTADHKVAVMCVLLEVMTSVMQQRDSLSPQTAMLVISAVTTSTAHLSYPHFVQVYQAQVVLVLQGVQSWSELWQNRPVGLLSCVQHLVQRLVHRSRQDSAQAHLFEQELSLCCLSVERLVRVLTQYRTEVQMMVHLTVAGVITALHATPVISSVKKSIEGFIYTMLKLCYPEARKQLLVTAPAETKRLVEYYHHNYVTYYAFNAK